MEVFFDGISAWVLEGASTVSPLPTSALSCRSTGFRRLAHLPHHLLLHLQLKVMVSPEMRCPAMVSDGSRALAWIKLSRYGRLVCSFFLAYHEHRYGRQIQLVYSHLNHSMFWRRSILFDVSSSAQVTQPKSHLFQTRTKRRSWITRRRRSHRPNCILAQGRSFIFGTCAERTFLCGLSRPTSATVV
jgi:hypothetical protein